MAHPPHSPRRCTHPRNLGLDVGKGEHHATAVTPAGKNAFDKRLPNIQPELCELFAKLQAGSVHENGQHLLAVKEGF